MSADLVDCMIAVLGQLFLTVQIEVCLWILSKNKADKCYRDRRTQFDARKLGFCTPRASSRSLSVAGDRVTRDLARGFEPCQKSHGRASSSTRNKMYPHHYLLHPPRGMVQRIERAFFRLHELLCLIEREAARTEIERAERSYRRSLQKLDVSERELVRHYPKFRFAMLAREAAARAGALEVVAIPAEDLN